MKTVYACTHVEKTAEVDDFEKGCIGDRLCVMFDPVNIQADSLKGLVDAIGKAYGLEMDDLFVPDEDGRTNVIGFNRLEDADGNEPSKAQERQWKAGKLTLYLADYYFLVEKRSVEQIAVEEFELAEIKVH